LERKKMFLGVCAKSLPLEVCRLHTHGGAENILQKMTLLEQLRTVIAPVRVQCIVRGRRRGKCKLRRFVGLVVKSDVL
jgi:hypothetical protein